MRFARTISAVSVHGHVKRYGASAGILEPIDESQGKPCTLRGPRSRREAAYTHARRSTAMSGMASTRASQLASEATACATYSSSREHARDIRARKASAVLSLHPSQLPNEPAGSARQRSLYITKKCSTSNKPHFSARTKTTAKMAEYANRGLARNICVT